MPETFARTLLDAIPDAVIVADPDARITYANSATETLLGWSRDELIGQPLNRVQPERMRAELGRLFARFARSRRRRLAGGPMRIPVVRRDDSEVEVELNLSVINVEGGERLVVGVLRDLSARIALERQLTVLDEVRQAQERFALLARAGAALGVSLDPDETVVRVAGVSVPDLCDWCVVDLADDDGQLKLAARAHRDPECVAGIDELRRRYPPDPRGHAIYTAIREGRTVAEVLSRGQLKTRARDAEHLQLLSRLGIGSHVVTPLATRDRTIGAVSFVRGPGREPFDTEAIATAEDIARRAAVAIDNARLHRAVQDAVDLRDEFMAVASHELRTPLTVVGVHWELLERAVARAAAATPDPEVVTLDRERISTTIARLGEAVRQLRRLITELLDVNRIQRGTLEMREEEADLVEIVRHATEEVAEPARIKTDLPDAAIIGRWDPGRLRQVLDNLLGNALKYSRPGSPVSVALTSADGVARLAVKDAGIGVPPDQRQAIFRPFTRARNVSSRNYPGLGLGLALSREIVSRSGGRIWVESAGESSGSTFVVELPVSAADGAAGRRGRS